MNKRQYHDKGNVKDLIAALNEREHVIDEMIVIYKLKPGSKYADHDKACVGFALHKLNIDLLDEGYLHLRKVLSVDLSEISEEFENEK